MTGGALVSRSPNRPKPNSPIYWTWPDNVLVNSCSIPKLTLRISGLCRRLEIGRTRPQFGGQAGPTNSAGLGKLGNAASTAGLVVVTVRRVLPSKFKESRTTLLNASTVLSAKESLNRVFSQGA